MVKNQSLSVLMLTVRVLTYGDREKATPLEKKNAYYLVDCVENDPDAEALAQILSYYDYILYHLYHVKNCEVEIPDMIQKLKSTMAFSPEERKVYLNSLDIICRQEAPRTYGLHLSKKGWVYGV